VKRRTVIWSPILLGARRGWDLLAKAFTLPVASGEAQPLAADSEGGIVLENSNHRLAFDSKTARLHSLKAKIAPDQEFAVLNDQLPAFVIQYLDSDKQFQQVASNEAKGTDVKSSGNTLTAEFTGLGGMDVGATVKVRTADNDPLSYWTISIRNHANLLITDVQFPFIIVPYQLGGKPGSESLLQPYATGKLWEAPKPQDLEPDSAHAWQFRPENSDAAHYPGLGFAQFLAYYNDRAGVFVSGRDQSGGIKLIKPVHNRVGGIRLGFAHVGDWPVSGDRDLGYDVVLQTFKGDWYDAAGLYREWSLKQPWASKPLHQRKDVPDWLLDSPPHIIVRIQGELDFGPAEPNKEFLPYPRIIPLLEKVSQRIESPLVAVIMSWERPGPWIYPDCFPPAGGDESLSEFTRMARDRGWHVGSFCNGTRWVTGHFWSGYDGRKYYADQKGEETVCQTHEAKPWREAWDSTWRPSYACCLGVARTRQIADDFARRLFDDGLDWLQFLDQNVGCATFPCFAADHGHPPSPGKWMNSGMQSLLESFRQIIAEEVEKSQNKRGFVLSVESPPNEFFMSNFQVCDQRVVPPGHTGFGHSFFPLYSFLYHEFIVLQGGFGSAPEPYHMPIRNAYNLVVGEIPGGVLTGDGLLLNRDTFNWAPWRPPVGSNDNSLSMLRSTAGLRRGKARDFLVFGRMQRPAEATGIKIVHWERGAEVHNIPAVFHCAWQDPRGRFGIVLSNWTTEVQTLSISDSRLSDRLTETISAEELKSRPARTERGKLSISLPALSCALIENT
jgi:hypothetical protein